jgi:hypothetical protein
MDIFPAPLKGTSSSLWSNTKEQGMEIFKERLKKEISEGPDTLAETLNERSGSEGSIKYYNKIRNKSESRRKCIKGRTREAKEQCKISRNRGQTYVTESGKVVDARAFKSLSPCRMKCSERFDEVALRKLFEEYWSAGDRRERADYLADLITSQPKSRLRIRENNQDKSKYRQYTHTYHLKIDGSKFPVCKGCFLRTFNESNKFIEVLLHKKLASSFNIIINDTHGRISPGNRWSEDILQKVQEYIQSVPPYESNLSEKNIAKHTPSHYTLTKLYEEYMACCASEQAVKQKTKILKLKLPPKDNLPHN